MRGDVDLPWRRGLSGTGRADRDYQYKFRALSRSCRTEHLEFHSGRGGGGGGVAARLGRCCCCCCFFVLRFLGGSEESVRRTDLLLSAGK